MIQEDKLRIKDADSPPGLRWFVERGGECPSLHYGFRTKERASEWIRSHGDDLDWRAGYLFRLKGDRRDVRIVNNYGRMPRP